MITENLEQVRKNIEEACRAVNRDPGEVTLISLNIEAGYRYIDMAGKEGNRDNTLADGAYAGVNFRF